MRARLHSPNVRLAQPSSARPFAARRPGGHAACDARPAQPVDEPAWRLLVALGCPRFPRHTFFAGKGDWTMARQYAARHASAVGPPPRRGRAALRPALLALVL